MNLEGKSGIVTGSGRGIGRDVALLLAKEGASVIVNDPGVGRGGEEMEYLKSRGIDVEVVPGITAALGAAAAAGIPLTHRGRASAVTFASSAASVRRSIPAFFISIVISIVIAGSVVATAAAR